VAGAADGVDIAVGVGFVVGFVVDETAKGVGDMAKQMEAANNAAIDYWASPDSKNND
jgi:hypothetical protein